MAPTATSDPLRAMSYLTTILWYFHRPLFGLWLIVTTQVVSLVGLARIERAQHSFAIAMLLLPSAPKVKQNETKHL